MNLNCNVYGPMSSRPMVSSSMMNKMVNHYSKLSGNQLPPRLTLTTRPAPVRVPTVETQQEISFSAYAGLRAFLDGNTTDTQFTKNGYVRISGLKSKSAKSEKKYVGSEFKSSGKPKKKKQISFTDSSTGANENPKTTKVTNMKKRVKSKKVQVDQINHKIFAVKKKSMDDSPRKRKSKHKTSKMKVRAPRPGTVLLTRSERYKDASFDLEGIADSDTFTRSLPQLARADCRLIRSKTFTHVRKSEKQEAISTAEDYTKLVQEHQLQSPEWTCLEQFMAVPTAPAASAAIAYSHNICVEHTVTTAVASFYEPLRIEQAEVIIIGSQQPMRMELPSSEDVIDYELIRITELYVNDTHAVDTHGAMGDSELEDQLDPDDPSEEVTKSSVIIDNYITPVAGGDLSILGIRIGRDSYTNISIPLGVEIPEEEHVTISNIISANETESDLEEINDNGEIVYFEKEPMLTQTAEPYLTDNDNCTNAETELNYTLAQLKGYYVPCDDEQYRWFESEDDAKRFAMEKHLIVYTLKTDKSEESITCSSTKHVTFKDYARFSHAIAADIIKRQAFSDHSINRICRSHFVANKNKLDEKKMLEQIEFLKSVLNVSSSSTSDLIGENASTIPCYQSVRSMRSFTRFPDPDQNTRSHKAEKIRSPSVGSTSSTIRALLMDSAYTSSNEENNNIEDHLRYEVNNIDAEKTFQKYNHEEKFNLVAQTGETQDILDGYTTHSLNKDNDDDTYLEHNMDERTSGDTNEDRMSKTITEVLVEMERNLSTKKYPKDTIIVITKNQLLKHLNSKFFPYCKFGPSSNNILETANHNKTRTGMLNKDVYNEGSLGNAISDDGFESRQSANTLISGVPGQELRHNDKLATCRSLKRFRNEESQNFTHKFARNKDSSDDTKSSFDSMKACDSRSTRSSIRDDTPFSASDESRCLASSVDLIESDYKTEYAGRASFQELELLYLTSLGDNK